MIPATNYQNILSLILGMALLMNALLFIPQAIKIWQEQTTRSISLTTFLGFWFIQLVIVIHGVIRQDYLLALGYLLSMLTCGVVIFSVVYFRYRNIYVKGEACTLEEVVKQLPGHLYWKNKVGVFLGGNTKNWQDFGLGSLENYLGKTDYDILSKPQADAIVKTDQKVIHTGKRHITEETVSLADGTTALFLSHKYPLRNRYSKIIGMLGVSLDITQAKQAEMERLDFLESILALMPGHVYWIDREGVYQGCNNAQAKSAGLSHRKDIVGKRNNDLPWNYNTNILPKTLDKMNQEVLETGKTIVAEEPAKLANGDRATFLSSKVPMRNKTGEVIGMVGISIDITQLKNTEKSLQETQEAAEVANRLKTEFMRNMEHDIRTPFSGVLGLSKYLWEEELDPTKKENLGYIVQSAEELLDYCNAILDFEKVESGISPILEKKFRLSQLIEKAIKIENAAAQHKQLQLTFNHDAKIPKLLLGDSYRLHRILLNLLGNAIKFTEAGSIKLKTCLLEQNNKQAIIQFTVQDSGIGISNEQKNLIFERFIRLSLSNKGFYKGLGLGLQVVKRFMHELGGEIEVTSNIGKGTTFICTIPFRLPLTQI